LFFSGTNETSSNTAGPLVRFLTISSHMPVLCDIWFSLVTKLWYFCSDDCVWWLFLNFDWSLLRPAIHMAVTWVCRYAVIHTTAVILK